MSYKAIRTKRHKYIHWTQKSLDGVACDELYDLKSDPYEMRNLIGDEVRAEEQLELVYSGVSPTAAH